MPPTCRVRAWAQCSLDYIFPPGCAACDARVSPEAVFCPQCLGQAPGLPQGSCQRPLAGAASCQSAGRYAAPLSTAIQRLKFKDRPDLAQRLALYGLPCWRQVLKTLKASPRIVPVPAHPLRLAQRGYNVPALLARQLIALSHGQLDTTMLQRLLVRAPQSQMPSLAARKANIRGSFACLSGPDERPIVLVDDVITSGSTALSCLSAILRAGHPEVHVFALASASPEEDAAQGAGPTGASHAV